MINAVIEFVFGPWFFLFLSIANFVGEYYANVGHDKQASFQFRIIGIICLAVAALLWRLAQLAN